jgi:glutathione S-transferase
MKGLLMLALYHGAASTCSQKVRLVLAGKALEFESREIDLIAGEQHDPDYVKLNPNHVVPTLVHNGSVLIESSLINEYLEDAFPEVPMLSADPVKRHAARLWIKRADMQVQQMAGIVTFAMGPRNMILNQPEEVRERNLAEIPDPKRRAERRSVIENGVKAPEFEGALRVFINLLNDMESDLENNTWLSGESFGIADACMLPYVLRLDHLAMTPLLEASVRPNLADWYARLQALPYYGAAVTDWLPEALVSFFRSTGEAVWNDIEPMTR